VRLAYLVSHLFNTRHHAAPDRSGAGTSTLTVFFGSTFLFEAIQMSFGVNVKWDVPLLDGTALNFTCDPR